MQMTKHNHNLETHLQPWDSKDEMTLYFWNKPGSPRSATEWEQ